MTANVISTNDDSWRKPEFWEQLCPNLSIGKSKAEKEEDLNIPKQTAEQRRQNLNDNGYTLVNDPISSSLVQSLVKGIQSLQGKDAHKYPASFIFLFDEAWQLANISRTILKESTHPNNQFHLDILAWYIDNNSGGGFSPHRDRQPDNAQDSFHTNDNNNTDGNAKFVTHWIALGDATPETSCLYVIPKSQDPGYTDGDTGDEDPLRRALPDKNAFQQIRALPRRSGESILFTHRIIHWGSARDVNANVSPRVAISFVCSDPSFEKPHINSSAFGFGSEDGNIINPPFHLRLLLVCAQLLIYYQRFDLPKETIKACYDYCKEYEHDLDEDYRKKVYVEFVKAMKEAKAEREEESATSEREGENAAAKDNNNDSEEDEEAVMEEMLNAEQGGYGEFEDDYDEDNEDEGGEGFGGGGEEDFDEEDEEEVGGCLFAKPTKEGEPSAKKQKR